MKQETKQTLIFLGSTHFLIHVFSQILQATLPVIRQQYGLTLTEASLLVSIPMLLQVLLYIPVGYMADRKANLVLSASFIATALGALLVPNASGYIHLIAAFSLISLGSTLYHPPALKATSEIPGDKKGLAMGLQNGGGSLGYSAGPLLYGLLLPFYGWRISYYLWVPLIAFAALYSYRFISHTRTQPGDSPRESLKGLISKRYLLVITGGALTDAIFIGISTYITTYFTEVRGISPGLAGVIFGVGPLLGILGSVLGGSLGDRVGLRSGFLFVLVGMGVSLALIPLTGSVLVSSFFYVVWRGFYSASMPLVNLMIADTASSDSRSLGFSVYSIASSLVGAAVPPLFSAVILGASMGALFTISIALFVPVAVIMLSLGRKPQH
jgi:FSR family fosmidomycin resistance protein-like MFS transporter